MRDFNPGAWLYDTVKAPVDDRRRAARLADGWECYAETDRVVCFRKPRWPSPQDRRPVRLGRTEGRAG